MRINEKNAIMNLQKYLRQLSYFDNDIPLIAIDGIYDEETEYAVKSFQSARGIPSTGVADRRTWDMIYDEYTESLNKNSYPETILLFPLSPSEYSVGRGDEWFLVDVIQYMLFELTHGYDSFEELEKTGVYDTGTENAVKEFQRRNRIEDSGRVDKKTWDLLALQFNNVAKNKNE